MDAWSKVAGGRVGMVLIVLGTLALPYLAKTAFSYKAQAGVAERQLMNNQRQVEQQASAQQQLLRWQQARSQWDALAGHADELGWRTSLWNVRSIDVDSKRYSRREADTLISSLESSRDGFMLAKAFSMKLMSNSGSLFITSSAGDQAGVIQLSLSGNYYSRSTQ